MNASHNIPVTKLNSVGPARAKALQKLGIENVYELLRHYPRAYENRGDIKLLSDVSNGEKCALCLVVATSPKKALIRRGMSILKFRAYDESGTAEITYFNQDYLAEKFTLGSVFRFYGKVERKSRPSGKDVFSLTSPVAEEVKSTPEALPPLVPIYPLTPPLTQNLMSKLQSEAASLLLSAEDDEPFPEELLIKYQLPRRSFALKNIHTPKTLSDLAAAKKRLIFEEFFCFALGLSISGRKNRKKGSGISIPRTDISPLTALLPYKLTAAQEKAINEIKQDMVKDSPMCRILVGDVGCGKTVCAAAAIYMAVKNGLQAALMAPTEILASQHYSDLKEIFEKCGMKTALLTGSTPKAEKMRIYASLSDADPEKRIDIVIGTHALISEGVGFSALGLVITDEQHRFGVKQRTALAEKGKNAHTLIMSATPIPRSLALTLYGDLDLSVIDEMPPGRQRVDTYAVDESFRERINAFIKKQTELGGQVYIVCPAVEESLPEEDAEEGDIFLSSVGEYSIESLLQSKKSAPPLKSAVKYASELSALFPELDIAFVHGKMKAQEKDDVMRRFASGEIDVLVSTTVIEVGVNVPNASLMIVENAERFGLSQLHQLRGRVGRGSRKSYCILISDSEGEAAHQRLCTMKNMHDGFAIAEKDLAMRGPGDFIGSKGEDEIRQSGGLRFRLADMCLDEELFTSAFSAAREILESDPELESHPTLKKEIEHLFDLVNNA